MKSGRLIALATLAFAVSVAQAKEVGGFDCWKLGMSQAEVKACTQRGPYTDVEVTGGIETANGEFDGVKTNVSFVFKDDHLVKIHVWLCEQTNLDMAVSAATRAWRYLTREFGPVRLADSSLSPDVTETDFASRAHTLAVGLSPDKQDKFQIQPISRPQGASVWASVFRDPKYGYYVFLFFAEP